jgi:hypothetical protein
MPDMASAGTSEKPRIYHRGLMRSIRIIHLLELAILGAHFAATKQNAFLLPSGFSAADCAVAAIHADTLTKASGMGCASEIPEDVCLFCRH